MRLSQLYRILFLVFFWVGSTAYIILYEGIFLNSEVSYYTTEPITYDTLRTLLTASLVTLIAGSALATFEVLYFNKLLRKEPLGLALLIKTGFYLANVFFFTSLAVLIDHSQRIGKPLFHAETLGLMVDYLLSARMAMIMSYWALAVAFALFILQVTEKFGQGVLLSFLIGKYHQPREEARVFMFMDLTSSTAYAEKLGHTKYSQLIQDCFYDLTYAVVRHHAQIYQYVGDEVVLTWDVEKGVRDNHCINAFFDFDKAIKDKSDYYKEKYGVIPVFKAGVNLGHVMVAEVGELKKELAYHGDTLNTASRIQEKCSELVKRILVSERVKDALDERPDVTFEMVGSMKLKGKEEPVKLYEAIAAGT